MVARSTSGSVKTSSSSRLADENSETTAPSGPAVKEWSVSGGIVYCSPGASSSSRPSTRRRTDPRRQRNVSSFPGVPVERRMAMLGARLARIEDELLRAVAVGVDVGEQHQAGLTQPGQAEVSHLDRVAFGGRQPDPGGVQLLGGIGLGFPLLVARDHVVAPGGTRRAPSTAWKTYDRG